MGTWGSFPESKATGAWRWPLTSSAEVKNAWSYTSTPQYAFIARCSVKAQGQLYLYQNGARQTSDVRSLYFLTGDGEVSVSFPTNFFGVYWDHTCNRVDKSRSMSLCLSPRLAFSPLHKYTCSLRFNGTWFLLTSVLSLVRESEVGLSLPYDAASCPFCAHWKGFNFLHWQFYLRRINWVEGRWIPEPLTSNRTVRW
jgi:hypothetical protein